MARCPLWGTVENHSLAQKENFTALADKQACRLEDVSEAGVDTCLGAAAPDAIFQHLFPSLLLQRLLLDPFPNPTV